MYRITHNSKGGSHTLISCSESTSKTRHWPVRFWIWPDERVIESEDCSSCSLYVPQTNMSDASGWGQNSTESAGKTVSMDKCICVRRAGHVTKTVVKCPRPPQVGQSLHGLALMADFAQGLDASKLILAETVRFSNSSAIFVVNSAPALIAALIHHKSIHCPSVQLPPLSFWSICTREPRGGPSLTSSGKSIFSLC
jgi:hypothetical protein